MMLRRRGGQSKEQRGLASIVIVFTLLILISLISLGFARLMNRALQVSVNNQLGSAADYAAQSGIHDVAAYLQGLAKTGAAIPTVSDCNTLISGASPAINSNISGDNNTKYTCVLVNPAPSDLAYQNVPAYSSQVVKLTTVNGAGAPTPAGSLMFSWQANDSDKNATVGSGTTLYDETTWASGSGGHSFAPALRVTLYPIVDASTPINSATLQASSRTFFFYPNTGAAAGLIGTTSFGATSGTIVKGNCGSTATGSFNGTADYLCNATVTGLPSAAFYYARITPLYEPTDVKVKANDASNAVLKFQNIQSLVDVTAKANDAVKRLQARVPVGSSTDVNARDNAIPEYGIRSANTICKRIIVPSAAALSGYVLLDPASAANSDACKLFNITLPPPTVTLTAAPPTITTGGSTTVTWTLSGTPAVSCDGTSSGPTTVATWNGTRDPSGGIHNLTVTLTTVGSYTFGITCKDASGGSTTPPSVTVTVKPHSPTVDLKSDDSSLTTGQSTTLRWTTTDATYPCTASGAWTGNTVLTSGSQGTGVFSSAGSYTYTLTCNGPGSPPPGQDSVTITVSGSGSPPPGTPPPPTPPPGGGGPNCFGSGGASPGTVNPGGGFSYSGVWSHCYGGAVPFGTITSGGRGWNGPAGDGTDNNVSFNGNGAAGGSGGWGGIRGIGNGNGGSFDIAVFVNNPPPPGGGGGGGGGGGPPPPATCQDPAASNFGGTLPCIYPAPPPGCGLNSHFRSWFNYGSIFAPRVFFGRVIC